MAGETDPKIAPNKLFAIIWRSVLALLIGGMSAIIIVNVLTRYIFSFSLVWSAEAAQYCMVWAAFIAMAVLVFRKEHLTMDLLPRALGGTPGKILRIFIQVVSLCFYVSISYFGILMVTQTRGEVASSIRTLPMNVVYCIIPIAGSLMSVGVGREIYREFRQKEGVR